MTLTPCQSFDVRLATLLKKSTLTLPSGALVSVSCVERASGRSHLAIAEEYLATLGLFSSNVYKFIATDRARAMTDAATYLEFDLAYGQRILPASMASEVVAAWFEEFGDDAAFLTNVLHSMTDRACRSYYGVLTKATFNEGVIGVSSDRVGLLWVSAED